MNGKSKVMPSARISVFTAVALMIILIIAAACFSATPSECIEAAEAAGLPDNTIEQLRNPGELNAIERAALNRVLSQAGIDDVCEAALEGLPGASEPADAPNSPQSDSGDPRGNDERDEPETAPGDRQGQQVGRAYAECLDDVYLRVSDDYDSSYWLPAAIWYCREMAPTPQTAVAFARCNRDQIEVTAQRYPEWVGILHRWHALSICNPLPTPDFTHIGTNSDIRPTVFSACLDNAYLTNVELIGDGETAVGISTWLCQSYLPESPPSHRQRCDLNHVAETQEIYPEWPEELHNWHAIMQCLPEWQLSQEPVESIYTTCLGDVYWQVVDRYPKDHAIPAAVWQCRDHMPEPPTTYNPRCEINHQRRDEESHLQWPDELYAWNAIIQCYPEYRVEL